MAIKDLPNLGPKSQIMLEAIGIETEEDFLQADMFEVYGRLKTSGQSVSLNMLYAMLGAQQNISWQTVKQQQKMEIVLRLEEMGLLEK